MPDIRSFFAPKGGSSQPPSSPVVKPNAATPAKAAGRKRRNVVSDDEDEDEAPPSKKSTPKPPPKTAKKEEPVEKSAYFSDKKVSRSAPVRSAKKSIAYKVEKDEEDYFDDDDDDVDNADNIYKEAFSRGAAADDKSSKKKKTKKATKEDGAEVMDLDDDDAFVDDDDDEEDVRPKQSFKAALKKATPAKGRGKKATGPQVEIEYKRPAAKRKSPTPAESEIEDDEPPPKKKAPAKPRAAPTIKPKPEEDENMKSLFDSIPTVRAPTPPERDPDQKFKFDFKKAHAPQPEMGASKDIPEGAENCLTGLTFVFTGVQASLSREEGVSLVQRYGGKVTTSPSQKTSYVILGSEAGPKKLETIAKFKLKTIDEEGLFKLISILPAHGGSSVAAQASMKKKAEEEKKIIQTAKEMQPNAVTAPGKREAADPSSQLWTVKYAPTKMSDICGNKAPVERLKKWLENWPKAHRLKFKVRGEDGSGGYRAAMIHGPPGIGKTTAAHIIAKASGYDVIESNASDTRSKKLLESSLKGILDNRSLLGYFGEGNDKVDPTKQKIVLIMDEVDGMSAGDRGGVGQMAALIKRTDIPIICICNDRRLPKMKPFDFITMELAFRKPDANAVRSRIASIAYREGLKISPIVIDQLTEGARGDIRQIINMLSTFGRTGTQMDFDESKSMSKSWEKHIVLKPWDIAGKLLTGGMFAANSGKTLNDKIELYFNDHEFSYLMIQENYLKTHPSLANSSNGKERSLKLLQLADDAAQSISDGDLVDALIHGPQQQWSLMPTHAIFSTVRPASLMAGGFAGVMGFSAWLGMNSKQGKLTRFIKEIQSHMRLRSSADRHEVRQHYVPMFWNMLARRLQIEGKDSLDDIIALMDDYYLTKEDWDAIVELGVGDMDQETLKIESLTKSAFTRKYNLASHPMPFMKASSIFAPKKGVKKEQPDLEEAIEESDDEAEMLEESKDDGAEEEDMDVGKDKYVKQAKPKKAAAAGKGKGKAGDTEATKKAPAKKAAAPKTAAKKK